MKKMNGMNGVNVEWYDLSIVYTRMQGRRLFAQGSRDKIAGHIMTMAAFGHAQRGAGAYMGAEDLIDAYCAWKGYTRDRMEGAYYAKRRKDWRQLWQSLPELVEELSK